MAVIKKLILPGWRLCWGKQSKKPMKRTVTQQAVTKSNNGNVITQTIEPGAATPITQSFGYDGLNRLETFSESGSVSETYGYDQWGNRWVSATSGLQIGRAHV